MEPSNGTVWHDEIMIGKWRKIAVRGLTPNHKGHRIKLDGKDLGYVRSFEHFSNLTVLNAGDRAGNWTATLDLAHLTEVEVEA